MYNILAKQVPNHPYIIYGFIATKVSKKTFEIIKAHNPELFKDYVFIPYKETDFYWWSKVRMYLQHTSTRTVLKKGVYFDCDFDGKVRMI